MRSMREMSRALSRALTCVVLMMVLMPAMALAQAPQEPAGEPRAGGEVNLVLPDLSSVDVGGYSSRGLLMIGLGVSALGMLFGLVILTQLKNLPVSRSMREISELIYETCKTYLQTQGKFIALLWLIPDRRIEHALQRRET